MADIELVHSAKGTSWIKRNHLWVSRKKVNGKWVYTYKTEQGHKDNVNSASNKIKELEDEIDSWNLNKKDETFKSGSSVSDNAKAIKKNFKRSTRKSKSVGPAAVKPNVNKLNKQKQKAYSDYESQKRMAASSAGAATRSNQYKNALKRSANKKKRQALIKKGKDFIRDLFTKLTNRKKYDAQQAYKKKMAKKKAATAAAKRRSKNK